MSRYFNLSIGLRGCYMPDSAHVIRVDTRRELKEHIESEARDLRDAGFVRLNKRAVAWLAAELWRRSFNSRDAGFDSVLPYRAADQRGSWPYGIFGSPATRSDYLEYVESVE